MQQSGIHAAAREFDYSTLLNLEKKTPIVGFEPADSNRSDIPLEPTWISGVILQQSGIHAAAREFDYSTLINPESNEKSCFTAFSL